MTLLDRHLGCTPYLIKQLRISNWNLLFQYTCCWNKFLKLTYLSSDCTCSKGKHSLPVNIHKLHTHVVNFRKQMNKFTCLDFKTNMYMHVSNSLFSGTGLCVQDAMCLLSHLMRHTPLIQTFGTCTWLNSQWCEVDAYLYNGVHDQQGVRIYN